MPFDGTEKPKSLLARTFERAAEIIETKGLVQGMYHGPNGTVCCLQALCDAAAETHQDVNRAVDLFGQSVETHICEFNNAPGRTKEQAAAAFRKAAKASA